MAKGRKPSRSSSLMMPPDSSLDLDSMASTPSEDEDDPSGALPDSRCPHVGKAVHLVGLKKTLKTAWTKVGQCGPCVKDRRGKDSESNVVDPSKPVTVWMCLRCGLQLCDTNSTFSHFAKHQEVPRSDLHCLGLNVMTWKLWCHECKAEVRVDSYKKVREAVDFVRRIEETKGRATNKVSNLSTTSASVHNVIQKNNGFSSLPKARGLANLGNTCFFNAVMQSLAHTHPVTHILDQHCQKGALFDVPSVQVPPVVEGLEGHCLEAMSLQLAEAGPITLALAAFTKEMSSFGKQGVVNPGHLFGQVCRKSPQFRGFQQQDAHELLRHLMEGLRSEEVKRQKSAILKNFDLSEKTDPKTVSSETRKKLQALGRHSNYTLVDKIFGGHLVSTIVCEQCHNSSQIYEPFLDLSLPLIEEKPQRPTGKKNRNCSPVDDNSIEVSCLNNKKKDEGDSGKTKSQIKREKVKSRKDKRKGRKKKGCEENMVEERDNKDAEGDPKDLVDDLAMEKKSEFVHGDNENEKTMNEVESASETWGGECNKISADENSEDVKVENVTEVNHTSCQIPKPRNVAEKPHLFENKIDNRKEGASKPTDGNDEDDEDDGYSEGDEDWEWDYGEQWEEGGEKKKDTKTNRNDDNDPECLEVQQDTKEAEPPEKPKLVSINPLSQELLDQISSERERSSEPVTGDNENSESETGASINGDVEDNLDDAQATLELHSTSSSGVQYFEPFRPDPQHLDPHMEQLCRMVCKMSVTSVNVQSEATGGNFGEKPDCQREYVISGKDDCPGSGSSSDDRRRLRLQNDWVARSLTSIAPRYQSKAGECSVYSCLTQFTAPELLTGNNKWACDKCTKLQQQSLAAGGTANGTQDYDSEEASGTAKKSQSGSNNVVYSNASKQLLIFSPPVVLTIHLKRFQQTMFNLRKVNRPVDFPLILDLAPFCSSTSLSVPNVRAGVKEILYELYAIVEHSGRLQGGHYTAFVKVRSAGRSRHADFYSAPTAKTEEIHKLLVEIEKKCQEAAAGTKTTQGDDDLREDVDVHSKWYYVSDSHVSEVSEEKVLKSQAYILFYERIK